ADELLAGGLARLTHVLRVTALGLGQSADVLLDGVVHGLLLLVVELQFGGRVGCAVPDRIERAEHGHGLGLLVGAERVAQSLGDLLLLGFVQALTLLAHLAEFAPPRAAPPPAGASTLAAVGVTHFLAEFLHRRALALPRRRVRRDER